MDVDGIIPMDVIEKVNNNEPFWEALEKTNELLKPSGLYITHLFQEDQIILTPDWLRKTVPINLELTHLKIQRPSTLDLILTKMMRGDDADLEEIEFLINSDSINPKELEAAYPLAHVPDIPKIREIFLASQEAVRKRIQKSRTHILIQTQILPLQMHAHVGGVVMLHVVVIRKWILQSRMSIWVDMCSIVSPRASAV